MIINPRGAGGAGKTEFVRRIMALYGGDIERVYRAGRARPICYRLRHPQGGRPLAVLGHYEVTSGGCDTIGPLDEAFRLADHYARRGQDVLFEGLRISGEYDRSAALARTHGLHVLRLATPLDQCVRNLIARRRARKDTRPAIAETVAARHKDIDDACDRLRQHATVEALGFEAALLRARTLLGLVPMQAAA